MIDKWQLVTSEQYKRGWVELVDGVPYHRDYELIRLADNGEDYIVLAPVLQLAAEHEDPEPPVRRPGHLLRRRSS